MLYIIQCFDKTARVYEFSKLDPSSIEDVIARYCDEQGCDSDTVESVYQTPTWKEYKATWSLVLK